MAGCRPRCIILQRTIRYLTWYDAFYILLGSSEWCVHTCPTDLHQRQTPIYLVQCWFSLPSAPFLAESIKKIWVPFRIYQLTSKVNPVQITQLSHWKIYYYSIETLFGWTQSDNTETTIPRYNFMVFYVFKMAVAIAFLCKHDVEAI